MNQRWLALLAFAAGFAQATGPDDYAIVMPIATPGDSAAWRIELPLDVYAWSQDEALRDAAVFDADGRAVPLAEWTPSTTTPSGGRQARILPLALPTQGTAARDDLRLLVERDGEGRLRLGTTRETPASAPTRAWLLDVEAFADGIDRLRLEWTEPHDGVFARFAIDASDDLQGWRTLRADAAIALLQQADARIERRTIALDGQRARYLRLRRLDDGPVLEDLAVDVERLARNTKQREPLQWQAAEIIVKDATNAAFDYRLPARLSIEALRVELVGDNSAAELALSAHLGTHDGRPLREPLLRLTAYRLRTGDDVIDQGDIALARSRRLDQLHLASTRPLAAAPKLQVGWRPPSLVFLAEGRAPYVLAAGHAEARREAASLATPLAVLRARFGNDWQPPLATPGAAREAAGQAALTPPPPPTSWRSGLLWGVLIAGAVLVAGIALSLLRGQR
ncbi:MAG TPA: DUF3999 family protein [Dokdonella sp.]|nr:DUF3999 family protein [Dokdonella sp.]